MKRKPETLASLLRWARGKVWSCVSLDGTVCVCWRVVRDGFIYKDMVKGPTLRSALLKAKKASEKK